MNCNHRLDICKNTKIIGSFEKSYETNKNFETQLTESISIFERENEGLPIVGGRPRLMKKTAI